MASAKARVVSSNRKPVAFRSTRDFETRFESTSTTSHVANSGLIATAPAASRSNTPAKTVRRCKSKRSYCGEQLVTHSSVACIVW